MASNQPPQQPAAAGKGKGFPLPTKAPKNNSKNQEQPTLFQAKWAEFIHRVKVHELLRCLENEQKKLKILREQSDLNDLLIGEKDTGAKDEQAKILFMRGLDDEKRSAEELVGEVRNAESEAEFVSKSALRLFKTKLTITDEQFEQILDLCKDRVEQKQLRDAFIEKKNREKYLHNATEMRRMLYEFLNSVVFNRIMLCLIAISTVIIVMLTFESIAIRYSWPLQVLDALIISVFIVEAACKISIYKEDYFKNMWNNLDLIIILTHFVEVAVDLVTKMLAMNTEINRTVIFKLLKSLRSLRLLRAIKFLPNLQVIVTTIFQSMLSMGSIAVLMALFIFLFAIIGRGFFSEHDPVHFKNIWVAMLTLFELLTLDDWYDLLGPAENYAMMFFYLFFYIVLEFFVFLNLFVAVLVDNFQLALEDANFGEAKQRLDFEDASALGLGVIDEDEDLDTTVVEKEESNEVGQSLELNVEDYFPLDKDSPNAKLIGENMKILASLDFESYMWVRRMKLLASVLDVATASKQNTWNVHEETSDMGMEDDRHTQMHETFKAEKTDND